MKKLFTALFVLILLFPWHLVLASDLDVLSDLAEEPAAVSASDTMPAKDRLNTQLGAASSKLSVTYGGYLKILGYWNEERYSDALWNDYFANYAALGQPIPKAQKINGYNFLGSRMQLKLEGFLEDKARLFASFNVNFNTAGSIHETTSEQSSSETGDIRQVEAFVEIYQGGTTWKIGSQLVTWGYLEGIEVPTDRVNARDFAYKSTEYEDSKLASTGILMSQRIYSSRLDILFIPKAKTNVNLEFQEYLYPVGPEPYESKPNNGKWATQFSSSLGNLDYALSYVEGLDPVADLIPVSGVILPINIGKKYNRIKSPGLDLQYNFGSLLAKASYVKYLTEDEDGTDLFIKNNWSKYVVGAEFSLFGSTVNLYAGQQLIEDYQTDQLSSQTNFLLGQLRERTDFVSGHINADFLTGNALNLVLLAAGYWDEEGTPVQTNVKATVKYKLANGLELVYSPGYMDLLDNVFVDHQFEVKYSF